MRVASLRQCLLCGAPSTSSNRRSCEAVSHRSSNISKTLCHPRNACVLTLTYTCTETRTHTHMRAYTYTQSRHTNTCAHTQTNTDASRCKVPYHGHVKIDESSCHSWGGVSDVRSLQIETWLHGLIAELARAAAIQFIAFVLISDLENLLVF